MTDERKLKDLSRQQLYDLIWSTPIDKVAADFGVAEATVKNHCNNRRVPRPTQSYWRKLAAGIKPRKKPLLATPQETFEIEAQRRLAKRLALPEPDSMLHPLAAAMLLELKKTKPDHKNLINLKEVNYPEINVTKALIERAAQAFHVLLNALEPLGIEFKKYSGSYDSGYFRRGQDRLIFTLEEVLHDRLNPDRRMRWYQSHQDFIATGQLAISYNPSRYGIQEAKEWQETKSHKLQVVLSEVVAGTRLHFLTKQRKRIQEAIDRKKWEEESERRRIQWEKEEAIREQKEAEKAHADAIMAVKEVRKQDLIKAAEWWRRSQSFASFLTECESRWKEAAGELNPEQQAWLAWAKDISTKMSPFAVGYPCPRLA